MEVFMNSKKSFSLTAVLFLLFLTFTAAVSFVDVQPIGPEGSSVGLATVNSWVFKRLDTDLRWYSITNCLGVVAILFACGFGLLGLVQLVKRKSLLKVDYQILLLGALYVVVVAAYLFFESVVINYRPVILESSLEASYPSSHTMLVVCIMATAIIQFHRLFAERKGLPILLDVISVLIIAVTIIGRLISGVHWFSDIMAGIILSAALVMLYRSCVKLVEERQGK